MTSTFGLARFGARNAVAPLSTGFPAAMYPGAVVNNARLTIAVDRLQTRLTAPLAITDTLMIVDDGAGIVASCLLSIDNEIVQVQSGSGNSWQISRGFDGTAPALHLASAVVSAFVDAWHHNALASEIAAIEAALGPHLSGIAATGTVYAPSYAFTQQPGGTLTVGTNQITLTPVPLGVNGSDANHYLYISGGTGAAEAVPITGGTAVSGAASGTVFVTCANAHSGAWTIGSATAGIQEAHNVAVPGQTVMLPPGSAPIYATVTVTKTLRFTSGGGYSGQGSVLVPQSAMTVFHVVNVLGAVFEDFYVRYAALQTSGRTFDLDNTFSTVIRYVGTENDYDCVYMTASGGDYIDHCKFGQFGHVAIQIYHPVGDSTGPKITNCTFYSPDTANAAIVHLSSGGIIIASNDFHNNSPYGYLCNGSGSSQVLINGNTFDGQKTAAISIQPTADFPGFTITGNFMSNFLSANYAGIYVGNANARAGVISGNTIAPWYTTGAGIGIAAIILNGTDWLVANNTISHSFTGIQSNAGVNITVGMNHLVDVASSFLGGGTNVRVTNPFPVTVAQVTSATLADGSQAYISDGRVTSPTDNTLAAGGNGCLAIKLNGVWRAFATQN